MDDFIKSEVRRFQDVTGLSDHRTGIVLANNGRLVERIESGGRIWPETKALILSNIQRELSKRTRKSISDAAKNDMKEDAA